MECGEALAVPTPLHSDPPSILTTPKKSQRTVLQDSLVASPPTVCHNQSLILSVMGGSGGTQPLQGLGGSKMELEWRGVGMDKCNQNKTCK